MILKGQTASHDQNNKQTNISHENSEMKKENKTTDGGEKTNNSHRNKSLL